MRRGPCDNDASYEGLGGCGDGRVERTRLEDGLEERDFEIF